MTLTVNDEPIPLAISSDGIAFVGGTRVTLDTVASAFMDGATAEEIVQQYPTLELADVYAVIAYILRHRDTVEQYLRGRSEQRARVRTENEQRFDPLGVRDRLLARTKPAG